MIANNIVKVIENICKYIIETLEICRVDAMLFRGGIYKGLFFTQSKSSLR